MGVRPVEPRAQRGDQQQVAQPVEDGLLAGNLPADRFEAVRVRWNVVRALAATAGFARRG